MDIDDRALEGAALVIAPVFIPQRDYEAHIVFSPPSRASTSPSSPAKRLLLIKIRKSAASVCVATRARDQSTTEQHNSRNKRAEEVEHHDTEPSDDKKEAAVDAQ